jgi:hypothetical protein
MTNINIKIPDELHKKVKIQSAIQEITIKDFIISAIEKRLKNDQHKH